MRGVLTQISWPWIIRKFVLGFVARVKVTLQAYNA